MSVGLKDSLCQPVDIITTREFLEMLIMGFQDRYEPAISKESSKYLDYALQRGIIEDLDITNMSSPIQRRNAARIVHNTLIEVLHEKDEDEWSEAEAIKDLYSCRTCVMHIAQVYVKGIMITREDYVFDNEGVLTRDEAVAIVDRMLHREKRIIPYSRKKLHIIRLSPKESIELLQNDYTAMLIDVRTAEEYQLKHIEGSINIPLQNIIDNPFSVCERKDTPIILYCQRGYKSSIAAHSLFNAGYCRVYTIPGIEE